MTDATASQAKHLPEHNYLLAALTPDERARVYPHLHLVSMPLGKVLYESGDALEYVYFPTDSIVSLLYVLESGASAEISVVGNEGLIGIALFMGGGTTPSRAIVQSAGHAYRLSGDVQHRCRLDPRRLRGERQHRDVHRPGHLHRRRRSGGQCELLRGTAGAADDHGSCRPDLRSDTVGLGIAAAGRVARDARSGARAAGVGPCCCAQVAGTFPGETGGFERHPSCGPQLGRLG